MVEKEIKNINKILNVPVYINNVFLNKVFGSARISQLYYYIQNITN